MSTAIRVGSIAVAMRTTGVCEVGEVGVCYEVYELVNRPGYSFIFEQGRHDGFSPDEVDMMLSPTGGVCPVVADYKFSNVGQLIVDYHRGCFAPAFRRARRGDEG
jgi:hypothetical protein